jgi:hypothetical protein
MCTQVRRQGHHGYPAAIRYGACPTKAPTSHSPTTSTHHSLLAVRLPCHALVPVATDGQDERRLHRRHAQQRKTEQVVGVRAVRIAIWVAAAMVGDVVHKYIVNALLVLRGGWGARTPELCEEELDDTGVHA